VAFESVRESLGDEVWSGMRGEEVVVIVNADGGADILSDGSLEMGRDADDMLVD
jgi:hypothetical protein